MKQVISLILIYCVLITSAFGQSVNPNDQLKIGKGASSTDKGIVFDTNDGASNKKLLIEKISKKLKFDGNAVQIGDGSPTSDKEIIVAGALKSLKYNGTSGEFEFNDDLKLSGELKSDILRAINTEVAVKSLLRAELGIKIGTGAHEIRVSGGNLEFSNDGSLYKKLGSGTGSGGSGGFNLITNDSFEDGIGSPWTSSGGTFTQETYAVGFEGNTKYARFVASGAGQYVEQIVSVPTSFSGGCQADFKKVNVSTAGLFKVQALDASDNVLAEQTIGVSSWVKVPTFGFPCPTSGTNNLKLRMTSIGAGTIDFDLGYIGSNQNLVNVSQAKLFGSLRYNAKLNCIFTSTNTSMNSGFTADADCDPPTVSGSASAPATKIPAIVLNNIPQGELVFFARGRFGNSGTAAALARFAIHDGTSYDGSMVAGANAPNYESGSAMISSRFTITSNVSSRTYQIWGATSSASSPVSIDIYNAGFVIDVYHFPSSAETAVSPEQSSWLIDANIGGGSISLGTAAVNSYSEMTNASLDLVINSNKGSASAQIACASGTASSGLTCSGANESVGISFIPPSAGSYEACFDFSYFLYLQTNSYISNAFQVVETSNTSSTIIQEGGDRKYTSTDTTGSQASRTTPFKTCGTFTFNDTSRKTIRLMFEQNIGGGSILSSTLEADRQALVGQRDIKVTVRPVLSAYNRPILTGDQVTTPGANKSEFFSVVFGTANKDTPCTASPCSYLSQIGNVVSNITRTAAGLYNLNLKDTYSKANCVLDSRCASVGGGTVSCIRPGSILSCENCNSLSFAGGNTSISVNEDIAGTIICHGIK